MPSPFETVAGIISETCDIPREKITLTVMERSSPSQPWQVTILTGDDILRIPEVGIEIPVSDIYEGISFSDQDETLN